MDPILWIAVIAILFIVVGTAIFQWLWNITMPEVFGLSEISFWQAFRLLLIAGFLTSSGFVRFNPGG